MNAATFDKSRLLTLYARIGETGNPIVLTFYNADGSEYNVESKGFKLIVKKRANSTPVLFTLSEGEGVTASGNQLTLSPSAANLTQKRDVNFYTLYSEDEDKTWLNGPFIFHDGEFDGVNQTNEITIGDSIVTIQISGGSGQSIQFQDEGVDLGNNQADTVNFTGSRVEATRTGDTITVNIDGGVPAPTSFLGLFRINANDITPPPTSGRIRYNNADQTLATQLFVHDITQDGIDIALFLSLLKTNDILVIQDKDERANYQYFQISGSPIDNTTYFTIPVTFQSAGGTGTDFSNNTNVFIGRYSVVSGVVESVTGDLVDNTDPANPVINPPTASQVSFNSYTPPDFWVTINEADVQAAVERVADLLNGLGLQTETPVDLYGAVGNGVTDDTTFIQNAVTAAGVGGIVRFTRGKRYRITRTITPLGGQTWIGYGATLFRSDEVTTTTTAQIVNGATSFQVNDPSEFRVGDSVIASNTSAPNGGIADGEVSTNSPTITSIVGNTINLNAGIAISTTYPIASRIIRVFHMITGATGGPGQTEQFKIYGLTFDGNRDNNESYQGWVFNSTFRNVPFNAIIQNCQFYRTPCENLFPTKGIRVIECVASDLNGSFVHFSAENDGGMSLCYANNVSNACQVPFSISGHNEAVFTYSARSQRVTISNNTVTDCDGWLVGPMSASLINDNDLIICNNDCRNLTGILAATSNPVNGDPAYVNEGIIITGNKFHKCGFLDFSAAVDGKIYLGGGHDRIVVNDNEFVDTKISFDSCSNLTANGNTIIFLDGYVDLQTQIPLTTDYANAITLNLCVNVTMIGNTIYNAATNQHSSLIGGIMLNIDSQRVIKTDALTSTRYLYGCRNFNISNNTIVGFGTSIRDRSSSIGQSNRAQYSAINCRISGNTSVLRNEASVSLQTIEVCPGVIFEHNSCYGGSNATRGISVAGVTSTYDATLNGGICRFNTIVGFNESIEICANAGSAQYNAIVEYNLYDGTIDDNSGGNSTVANNTAIVNESVVIVNPRENPNFY